MISIVLFTITTDRCSSPTTLMISDNTGYSGLTRRRVLEGAPLQVSERSAHAGISPQEFRAVNIEFSTARVTWHHGPAICPPLHLPAADHSAHHHGEGLLLLYVAARPQGVDQGQGGMHLIAVVEAGAVVEALPSAWNTDKQLTRINS